MSEAQIGGAHNRQESELLGMTPEILWGIFLVKSRYLTSGRYNTFRP